MDRMHWFYRYKLHHGLFWILLFAGWHYFRYQDYPAPTAHWVTLVKVVDLALLVYITNYVLIPRFLYRRQYWVFGIVFLMMVVSSSILKMYLLGKLMNNPSLLNFSGNLKGRIYDNVLPHILLVCTGAAFKLLTDQVKTQLRLAEMAREKSDAELNFLKSQVNPHFLFNSLNSIYFLINKENKEARQTLLQFSDLLRYQLYDCNEGSIDIEKEIHFLKDFIRLQQLRRDQQYDIEMQVAPEVAGFRITPLLLIPFVENAFKHISHHVHQPNFVQVGMQRVNGSFRFSVENSKDNGARTTEPAGGIGLQNVKRRLELLYPGKHRLQVDDNGSTFKVNLDLEVE